MFEESTEYNISAALVPELPKDPSVFLKENKTHPYVHGIYFSIVSGRQSRNAWKLKIRIKLVAEFKYQPVVNMNLKVSPCSFTVLYSTTLKNFKHRLCMDRVSCKGEGVVSCMIKRNLFVAKLYPLKFFKRPTSHRVFTVGN